MTEFEEQQQYAAALAARNDELTRLDVWRDRALKSEQLLRQCVADYESAVVSAATLKEALNLTQSFNDDAQRSAGMLLLHLRAVLEICRCWEPDYASDMDRKTLVLAANAASDPMALT